MLLAMNRGIARTNCLNGVLFTERTSSLTEPNLDTYYNFSLGFSVDLHLHRLSTLIALVRQLDESDNVHGFLRLHRQGFFSPQGLVQILIE